MNRSELLSLIAALNFPTGEWAIFGGACLTARNIRPTSDLEIFVMSDLYDSLLSSGWEQKTAHSTGAEYVTKAVHGYPVLAFVSCGSEQWIPDTSAYIAHPEIIDGYPYMPLEEMYKWKAVTARPKDLADLILIDRYLHKA